MGQQGEGARPAIDHTRSADGFVLPEAEEALHHAVTSSRIELRVPGVGGRLDWSPDGTLLVTEGPDDSGIVDIRDARTGESLRSFHGHDNEINQVAFNHDGSLLATTGVDGAARIWDPTTGEELHTLQGPRGHGVAGPSFSPDGTLFAAAWPNEGVAKVLDLATGQIVREIHFPGAAGTSFDPSGARVVVGSARVPKAVVVDVGSGNDVFTLEGHAVILSGVAWSPDGGSIATSSFDGSTRIYDARTGAYRFALLGRGGHVNNLDWSPDSTRLVTGHSDGTARVWAVSEDGAFEVFTLSAHDTRKGITGVAFSPDGTKVMTGDLGITATRVWDVSIGGGAELASLPSVAIAYGAVAFTPDGRHLVATSTAGNASLWDAQAFTHVRTLGAQSGSSPAPTPSVGAGNVPVASGASVSFLDVSRDGQLIAAARSDGSLRVWDIETGRDAFTVDTDPSALTDPAWNATWNPTATSSPSPAGTTA